MRNLGVFPLDWIAALGPPKFEDSSLIIC